MYTNGFGPITGWSLCLLVWLFEEVLISKHMLPQVDGTFLPGESFENPDISDWFEMMKSIADGVPPSEYICYYNEALEISKKPGSNLILSLLFTNSRSKPPAVVLGQT